MKRIVIILAALAILMSACINPIPPPDADLDPVVELSSTGTVVDQPVVVRAQVSDDTGGELEHVWLIEDALVMTSEATHANTAGFDLDVLRTNTGHTATYTFGQAPYLIDGKNLYYDGSVVGVHGVWFIVGGESENVFVRDTQYTISAISGSGASDRTVETVRFTIDGDPVDLDVGVPRVLTLSGYSVTVQVIDARLDPVGELASVDVQATYTYQGLTQQQQVRFTPTEGVRITLPEGTMVEAYLEGAVFRSSYSSVALSVNGETQTAPVNEPIIVGGLAVLVLNASGTSGLETSVQASMVVGTHILDLERGNAAAAGSNTLPMITATQNGFIAQSTGTRDQLFDAYDWVGSYDDEYYVDTTLLEADEIADSGLAITPKKAGSYTVRLTVTDERTNVGTDTLTFTVQ